jgi:hypothetical protein
MTTGRRKQETTAVRQDVTVHLEDGSNVRHKDALGWSVIQGTDVLIIVGQRVPEGDKLVNETLALYRKWIHVAWT